MKTTCNIVQISWVQKATSFCLKLKITSLKQKILSFGKKMFFLNSECVCKSWNYCPKKKKRNCWCSGHKILKNIFVELLESVGNEIEATPELFTTKAPKLNSWIIVNVPGRGQRKIFVGRFVFWAVYRRK